MKHLRTLACIADVARSGSIRKTLERLNITPSALIRRIQDFEEELGTSVFDRTAQGMRLNFAGELLVQHARDQVADLDRVRRIRSFDADRCARATRSALCLLPANRTGSFPPNSADQAVEDTGSF